MTRLLTFCFCLVVSVAPAAAQDLAAPVGRDALLRAIRPGSQTLRIARPGGLGRISIEQPVATGAAPDDEALTPPPQIVPAPPVARRPGFGATIREQPAIRPARQLELAVENQYIAARIALPSAPPGAPALLDSIATGEQATVQFARRLSEPEVASLAEAGVEVEGYIAGSTYRLSGDLSGLTTVPEGQLLTAGRVTGPGDKLTAPALDLALRNRASRFHVVVAAGADAAQLASVAVGAGAIDIDPVTGAFDATLTHRALRDLLRDPRVLTIDKAPDPFLPLNSAMRRVSDADAAQDFDPSLDDPSFGGVSGKGVLIAIYDDVVDRSGADFCYVAGDDSRFRPSTGSDRCGVQNDLQDPAAIHGTGVAAIAAGSGRNSHVPINPSPGSPFELRGVAPDALLATNEMLEDEGLTTSRQSVDVMRTRLAADKASVSNHSYIETTSDYDAKSQAIDSFVSGRDEANGVPARPEVWAAGNDGPTNRSQAFPGSVVTQAKNSISVGSIDTATGRVSRFSSVGPTFDKRIKPDVVAPGSHDSSNPDKSKWEGITTALPYGFYGQSSGTSQAAPVVTGAIALMCQRAGEAACQAARPATFKAVLIATARDLVAAPVDDRPGYGPGPDFASGFGLVDIAAAVAAMSSGYQQADRTVEGEPWQCAFDLAEGQGTLRLALAWDDPPSALEKDSLSRLVNDLDVVVIDPAGGVHLPWTIASDERPMAGTLPLARREIDRLNTVELVEAEAAPGRWIAQVTANRLAEGGQSFSLAGPIVQSEGPQKGVIPCTPYE